MKFSSEEISLIKYIKSIGIWAGFQNFNFFTIFTVIIMIACVIYYYYLLFPFVNEVLFKMWENLIPRM